MALTDKTIASTYGDILQVDNSGSGRTANGTVVKDGLGQSTALTLGGDKIKITPSSDSTTAVTIETSGGTDLLVVDSTNSAVKVGTTQTYANTQYLSFKCIDLNVSAGTHLAIPLAGHSPAGVGGMPAGAWTLGTSTDPSAPAFSNNGDDILQCIHYVDTNITVDSVQILATGDTATGDTINFHLCSLATSDTTTVNSWSSTTVVADCSDVSTAGREQFYRIALDIQSANVDAGNYLVLTIESDGTNSDYSVNGLVRYHLR
ncbi:MAG: hypothetical protein GOVbin212_9 [Prokaryotic dsDNA virus sp.]|nr:MAG: hypothetical protein GOVbin212_9 [Prokaryotic dsDNA virus sp.]|tara:strand:+ start:2939 stop:3721 length:783 start_codon:yes stop_codon:yes gene_type:complete